MAGGWVVAEGLKTSTTYLFQASSMRAASRSDIPSTIGMASSSRPLERIPPRNVPILANAAATSVPSSAIIRAMLHSPGSWSVGAIESVISVSDTTNVPERAAPRIVAVAGIVREAEPLPATLTRLLSGFDSSSASVVIGSVAVAATLAERAGLLIEISRKGAFSVKALAASLMSDTLTVIPCDSVAGRS